MQHHANRATQTIRTHTEARYERPPEEAARRLCLARPGALAGIAQAVKASSIGVGLNQRCFTFDNLDYCCFHCCCCYGWLLIIALLLRPEQDSLSVEQREAWRRSLPGASRSARIDSRIAPPSKFPGGWRRRRLGKFGDSQRRITRENDGAADDYFAYDLCMSDAK